MYANHGALKKHYHQIEGINSRLDGLQAAILVAKLPSILEWTRKRQWVAGRYNELLKDSLDIILPAIRPDSLHSWHLYIIQVNFRDKLQQYLKDKGIETAIHYPTALPNLPAYSYLGYTRTDLPVASSLESKILSLPIYPEMKEESIRFVSSALLEFFQH